MKKQTFTYALIITFLLVINVSKHLYAQSIYLHPTTGIDVSYAGTCLVNTCSGSYYDNGGAGSNYSLNINSIYRTFCPSSIGNCTKLTFSAFDTEGKVDPAGSLPLDCYYDYLTIGNGAAQNATLISIPGVTSVTNRICGTPSVPFSATSTSASGCLLMRFRSDNTITRPGWTAALSCVPCAGGPNGSDNNDCVRATPICTDLTITTNSTGPGLNTETCNSCVAGGEHHSNWYYWTMYTGGTLSFNIDPVVNTDDYDFALYGPMTDCSGTSSTPARCSYSDDFDVTGLSAAETDISEGVLGNSYVDTIHVKAGEKYYLFIDHWTPPSSGYVLDLILTDGASLDCSGVILPIELVQYSATPVGETVMLEWQTATETNNDYFTIEKSYDGLHYEFLTNVKGAENSIEPSYYMLNDAQPFSGENYYRLSQTDINGVSKQLDIAYAKMTPVSVPTVVTIYDLTGRPVAEVPLTGYDGEIETLVHGLDIQNGIYLYVIQYENGQTVSGKLINAK